MTISSAIRPALLVMAAGAFATPDAVLAQISPGGGPIVIEAETLDVFNDEGLAVYAGRVDAVQDEAQLRADRLELYFDRTDQPAGEDGLGLGALTHAIAIGNVYYVTPEQVAVADHGRYDIETDTVTMTGRVVVQQGRNVMTGEEMVLNLTTNDVQVRAGQAPASAARPARVRTVIHTGGGETE